MKTLGQIAYEAYGFDAQWKTFNGKNMPPWGDLGPDVQRHWQAAAEAVRATVLPKPDVIEISMSDPKTWTLTDFTVENPPVTYHDADDDKPEPKKHSRSQRKTDTE